MVGKYRKTHKTPCRTIHLWVRMWGIFAVSSVTRYRLGEGGPWHDRGALPCPRCRSLNIHSASGAWGGPMTTCLDCGARSSDVAWNDGHVHLSRVPGKSVFAWCGEKFDRPRTDVIVITQPDGVS